MIFSKLIELYNPPTIHKDPPCPFAASFYSYVSPGEPLICLLSLCFLAKSLSCVRLFASLPGSSVHGILQARILEWVATPFSRGFSWPRDWIRVSRIAGRFFTISTTREAHQCPSLILLNLHYALLQSLALVRNILHPSARLQSTVPQLPSCDFGQIIQPALCCRQLIWW